MAGMTVESRVNPAEWETRCNQLWPQYIMESVLFRNIPQETGILAVESRTFPGSWVMVLSKLWSLRLLRKHCIYWLLYFIWLPSRLSRMLLSSLYLGVDTYSHSSSNGLFAKSSYFSIWYGWSIRLPSYPILIIDRLTELGSDEGRISYNILRFFDWMGDHIVCYNL